MPMLKIINQQLISNEKFWPFSIFLKNLILDPSCFGNCTRNLLTCIFSVFLFFLTQIIQCLVVQFFLHNLVPRTMILVCLCNCANSLVALARQLSVTIASHKEILYFTNFLAYIRRRCCSQIYDIFISRTTQRNFFFQTLINTGIYKSNTVNLYSFSFS